MSLASYHCSTPQQKYTRCGPKGKVYRPGFSPSFVLPSRPIRRLFRSFPGAVMNHPVMRSIVGVFVGVVVCVILISVIEYAASAVHPPPKGFDFNDPEQVRAHVENAPLSAMLLVLAGYAFGTFGGAYLAARVAGRAPLVHAGI